MGKTGDGKTKESSATEKGGVSDGSGQSSEIQPRARTSSIDVWCRHDEIVDATELIDNPRNPNKHPDKQIALLAKIIRNQGWRQPITVSKRSGFIVKGHGRLAAAKLLNVENVPVEYQDYETEAQEYADLIADNRIAELAEPDMDMIADLLNDDLFYDFDLDLTGFDSESIGDFIENGEGYCETEPKGNLADRFLVPPFSVLNAREGWWQDRKRQWLSLGIKSEVGRGGELHTGATIDAKNGDIYKGGESCWQNEGTSIFDPVLCELSYSWFSPMGGIILDPFAGGSVRGIVASKLGRQYIGGELRKEQVEANRAQAEELCEDNAPVWICDDSRKIDENCSDVDADMVFSCPPYADLEVYSDDPNDLSTLKYEEFRDVYFEIIKKACSRLKEDRFACFVVGEVRDKKGNYYDFVGDTVQAFRDAGLEYYNEIILVTCVGSLPIRAGRQFATGRKIGKTHQNILVFVKGDGKKAAEACGHVEVDLAMFDDNENS